MFIFKVFLVPLNSFFP